MGKPPKAETPLGKRLIELRGGKTRAAFAEELGIHVNTLGGYERGERTPDLEFLASLRQKLGIDINWLAFGDSGVDDIAVTDRDGVNSHVQVKAGPIEWKALATIQEFVEKAHSAAGIHLRVGDVVRLATAAYNDFVADDVDFADEAEMGARMLLLEKKLSKQISSARAEPGTGKRSA